MPVLLQHGYKCLWAFTAAIFETHGTVDWLQCYTGPPVSPALTAAKGGGGGQGGGAGGGRDVMLVLLLCRCV